jgi:prepilin-type N-terminal cleavage/methylation domain-containing protein
MRAQTTAAPTNRLSSQAGMSLVEVLVAVALVNVALMPLAYIQSSGVRNGVMSYEFLTASALAMDLADKIYAIPYGDPRLGATTDYVAPSPTLGSANPLAPDGTTCTGADCGFTRTWKISDNTPLLGPDAGHTDEQPGEQSARYQP